MSSIDIEESQRWLAHMLKDWLNPEYARKFLPHLWQDMIVEKFNGQPVGPDRLPKVPIDSRFYRAVEEFHAEWGWEPAGSAYRQAYYWWCRGQGVRIQPGEAPPSDDRALSDCEDHEGGEPGGGLPGFRSGTVGLAIVFANSTSD